MRRRFKVLILVGIAGLLISGGWVIFDWPPPRLLVKYGLPPAGGPTGRSRKIEYLDGLEFIELSPGYFRMGSHYLCEKGDLLGLVGSLVGKEWGTPARHDRSECPQRWMEIEEPFWIATTEVTNEIYELWARDDDHERDEYSKEDDQPAARVSWWAAKRFCRAASDWAAEHELRLPTEAQWEYACRAGTTTEFPFGDDPEALAAHAVAETKDGSAFPWSSENKPAAVGGQPPNPWGLYDMIGNLWEWCADNGPEPEVRIIRGGGCRSGPGDCRSATRRWTVPGRRIAFLGFRPVLVLKKEE